MWRCMPEDYNIEIANNKPTMYVHKIHKRRNNAKNSLKKNLQ
jgi:hypothetical protein